MPGVRLIQNYELSWLPKDIASGITLGMLMVPVGLAYGEMAGVPLAGLYAGILPLIAYALFGSSRQLIVGVDATMAALVAVSLSSLAGGDAGRLAVMACLMAVLIGLIYILGSFLHLAIAAAWNLCNFREFRRLWLFRGVGLLGALLTMAGVIGMGIKEGIGIGVAVRDLSIPPDLRVKESDVKKLY